jgi:hypothetical protein
MTNIKDLKDEALQSPDGMAIGDPVASGAPMPSLEQVGTLMIAVRDDIARALNIPVPENVCLVAVKVIYVVHTERVDENKVFATIANRQLVDPFYENILRGVL